MADTKAEPNVESDVNAESRDEEEPKREITQTDHINKHLLEAFMQKLDTSKFTFPSAAVGDEADDGNNEFDDDREMTPEEREEYERSKSKLMELLRQAESSKDGAAK